MFQLGPILDTVHCRTDGFMLEKEKSTLELAMPVLVKATDLFLRIRMEIVSIINLEAGGQSVLTIIK